MRAPRSGVGGVLKRLNRSPARRGGVIARRARRDRHGLKVGGGGHERWERSRAAPGAVEPASEAWKRNLCGGVTSRDAGRGGAAGGAAVAASAERRLDPAAHLAQRLAAQDDLVAVLEERARGAVGELDRLLPVQVSSIRLPRCRARAPRSCPRPAGRRCAGSPR